MSDYDKYPACLTAQHIREILGISKNNVYDLMRTPGFPSIRIYPAGKRIVIPKDQFIRWVEKESAKQLDKFIPNS